MIDELVLHPSTKQEVGQFIAKPSHSLILVGPDGSGKTTMAHAMAAQLLELTPEKLAAYPYFMLVQPEKDTISIEKVRQLQDFVRLKTTGRQALRRIIIIQDAHGLTTEAQNALLKLIEEPPADTCIILTADRKDLLLPTISSRAPKITVRQPSQVLLQKHFGAQGFGESDITKAYFISRGQAGLLSKLLQKDQSDERLQYIEQAKVFLRATPFERLVVVDAFVKQKQNLGLFLWALQRVADTALRQAAAKDQAKPVQHWQKILRAVIQAQDAATAHPQPKLLLTNLSLQC